MSKICDFVTAGANGFADLIVYWELLFIVIKSGKVGNIAVQITRGPYSLFFQHAAMHNE
jgi:hypothetical protein